MGKYKHNSMNINQFQENSATCVSTSSEVKRKMFPNCAKLPLKRRIILNIFCFVSSSVIGEAVKKQTG